MILIVGIIKYSVCKESCFHVVGLWKVKKQQEKVHILPRWSPRLQTSRNASNNCVGVIARIHRWEILCEVHKKIGNESTCTVPFVWKKCLWISELKINFLVILLFIYYVKSAEIILFSSVLVTRCLPTLLK